MTTTSCPPFNGGSFVINQFQLNASVAVYDPYKNQVTESITFPGISGDPALHVGPASVDPSGFLTVLVDAANPFNTGGQDVSGDNFIIILARHSGPSSAIHSSLDGKFTNDNRTMFQTTGCIIGDRVSSLVILSRVKDIKHWER